MSEVIGNAAAEREGRGEPAGVESPFGAAFAGDLGCLTSFELLQVLRFLGKEGELRLEGRSGELASCSVRPGGLLRAECGSLSGREAVLAFSWWKEGRFRFEPSVEDAGEAPLADVEPIPVQEILLEAVRLADEIEARSATVPDRNEPLETLLRDDLPRDLRAISGGPEIVEHLARRPGTSRKGLEAELRFAPLTIGFAVARLCEEGFVGPRSRRRPTGPPPKSGGPLRREGLVRVLIAFDRVLASEISEVVSVVYERLGVRAPAGHVDSASPTFLRSRLPSGRFLSVTVLPVSRRNRFVLESMAGDLLIAALVLPKPSGDEAKTWVELSSVVPHLVVAEGADSAQSQILQAMLVADVEAGV